MRTYTVPMADILSEIRTHRTAAAFWTAREMKNVAKDHTDSIRDLRIMLLNARFPENTFGFTYGADFTPYVVVTPDNPADNLSDSDLAAFADSLTDEANYAASVADTRVLISA